MAAPDLYFSFFMFTADLRPTDGAYTKRIIAHMRELLAMGYAGFDLPIAPSNPGSHAAAVESYVGLKRALDAAGLETVGITTNVGTTRTCDPTSPEAAVRDAALAYLRSRVDITAALGGTVMAGPVIFPYGVFPKTDAGQTIWSDALQDWVRAGYRRAQPVLEALGEHAAAQGVRVAIEPVDHWETAAPNLVSDVLAFLEGVASRHVGVCIDSAHVALGSDGPAAFAAQVAQASADGRLHDVHLSPPDRGAFRDSWIDWPRFLAPILAHYEGPMLVEVFNAIPAFLDGLRLTRRKFWIPGEDDPQPDRPSAYDVAREAIGAVHEAIARVPGVDGRNERLSATRSPS